MTFATFTTARIRIRRIRVRNATTMFGCPRMEVIAALAAGILVFSSASWDERWGMGGKMG